MPIGTDLVMHEESEPEKVRDDGSALGRVIERSARHWGTPLAVPLMDLRLEKIDLLAMAGISAADAEAFHFAAPIDEATFASLCGEQTVPLYPGSVARDEAIGYIRAKPNLIAVGMAIGPFSLTTRLMADPISAAAMAGSGVRPDESAEVKLLDQCLHIAEAAVLRSVRSQIAEGAQAIMICEPAACKAYISPRQMKAGSNLFERLVMEPNLRLKAVLDEAGCDLIFHDCGELIDEMVEAFANRLHPKILSLGSSRKLWEDACMVPGDVVLYGNLPTKSFYSDGAMPIDEVVRRTDELIANMKTCGHPHILGSECDVLFVPEAQETIRMKVDAMMARALVLS
jgi:uroporphyrinogen-III decarboxylase